MSANLDLVRSIYANWGRRDYSRADWADPDVEFVVVGGPAPGTWTGLAGMWQGWREVLSPWEDWRAEHVNLRELDDTRVFAVMRFAGRGKGSGLEIGDVGGAGANLFHIREHRVIRLVAYWELDRALADLGVEDSGAGTHAI